MSSPPTTTGPYGVTLTSGGWPELLGSTPELEALGFSTIWIPGGQLESLGRIDDVLRVTSSVTVATAIIPVSRFDDPVDIARSHANAAGRLVVGLGGARGATPLRTLGEYLDRLDVPDHGRILAALGPRMLELARRRTAGACTLLSDTAHTASAKALLGPDRALAAHLYAVPAGDRDAARASAGPVIEFLAGVPGYRKHFQRMGFTEREVADLDTRFFDAVVAWGDPEAIAARAAEHLAAGADHVALVPLTAESERLRCLRDLAAALALTANSGGQSDRAANSAT